MRSSSFFTRLAVFLIFLAPVAADAQQYPSSDLLLPYFEVDLTGFQLTTSFQVGNSHGEAVDVEMVVHSNWGIPVVTTGVTLEPHQMRAFNLRDWLMLGHLPDRELSGEEIAHVKATLSGEPSPVDGLYYGTLTDVGVGVGYVTVRSVSPSRPDALWGSYFVIDPRSDSAQADVLANIDRAGGCHDLCFLHTLFFLEGGDFDGGTELLIWTERRGQPQASSFRAVTQAEWSVDSYDEAGAHQVGMRYDSPAVQAVRLSDMGLSQLVGTLRLTALGPDGRTPAESFIAVRYSAEGRYSAGLQSWCEPKPPIVRPPNPAVDLEKHTNGHDADEPTGPEIPAGDAVTWEYIVENTGNAPLHDVVVTDDDPAVTVACPHTSLGVGASMTCTATGVAVEGRYANLGTVTAFDRDGTEVSDDDPSHYFGTGEPPPPPPPPPTPPASVGIDIEKATNGQDADTPTGPTIEVGGAVTWTYVVVNTGELVLGNVVVTDDDAAVHPACPQTTLAVGESMTCSAAGIATEGQYANVGTVTAVATDDRQVSDADPSHYFGELPPPPPPPPSTCDVCQGKVTRLTLQYQGAASAVVKVVAKRGPDTDAVFEAVVHPGGTFEVVGPADGTPGHADTLGTEIRLYVDGVQETFIHTSCSVPVGPGLVAGSFLVLEGESSGGGALCPL